MKIENVEKKQSLVLFPTTVQILVSAILHVSATNCSHHQGGGDNIIKTNIVSYVSKWKTYLHQYYATVNCCAALLKIIQIKIKRSINLLAPELFFLILAHPVYKM